MREARANILRMGGIPRVNTFSKLYLALMGQFPWKYLPTIPVEMVLLPTWAPFHIYKMSSWSRAMLVPLAIINHFKPMRELPGEKQLHELYPARDRAQRLSACPRDERVFTWRNLFLRADDALKMLHRIPWKPLRRIALEEAERWMIERIGQGQRRSGHGLSRQCLMR
jgi:squalene-hopene/tetraprenyl-beta-curcumene cyclase